MSDVRSCRSIAVSIETAASAICSWDFHVDRDRHDESKLFFFSSDPDAGNAAARP
ncbi:hypothetical protein [Streptomyces tritici]|uniref:hypothetical protein n=1 Tax=Streptomyces tritici TaxID=2054410 RepID=UPI003AEF69A9